MDAGTGATTKCLNKDAVAVVVIEDKDVVVAVVGGYDKLACLVGVDLTSGRVDKRREATVGASVVGIVAARKSIASLLIRE